MSYETALKICDVVNDISAGKYVLPSIQREYVWSTKQIERLFDSLMRDYPVGAFLFWELQDNQNTLYDFYGFLQNYHEKNATHNTKINLVGNSAVMAVLDGQQRLTSLFLGLKGTYAYKMPYRQINNPDSYPERKLYLNLVEPASDETEEYNFSFLTTEEATVRDEHHYWFLVGEILNMPDLGDVNKYINRYIYKDNRYNVDQGDYATDCLSQLYKVVHVEPTISYYKVKSEKLDTVLQIFIRVNSGGTVLSYSDLLLSMATAQWENLDARKEITDLVDYINSIGAGFGINKDFVLKAALVLSGFSDIAFKVDNFNKPNMLKIEQQWPVIKKSIIQAYLLVSGFGFSRDSLKSNNAIIPIAYYLKVLGNPANFEMDKSNANNRVLIKKWLIRSLLKRAFGGQPDNILRKIRGILDSNGNKDFPLTEIINSLRGTNKSIIFNDDDINDRLEQKYGQSDTLLILMLLYPSLDYNNKFHVDHIYPKSKFTKKYLAAQGLTDAQIQKYIKSVNDLSNLQLLAAVPNIQKQDQDFDDWFTQNYPTDTDKFQYRQTNYIPDMQYSYQNFENFMIERKKLLQVALKNILV
ncbi:DUF262 domain-containing protein [uncultured Anaerovibrio sp.]|uniref:DUF262 domain-containing protein n=1 Tax=uncultured Anaerovibrio sp. TaxID=361586 RepID=UPI0025F2C4E2|nr:DUF262 domain-containing protein [uncultured Anaerovibrio sp.]